MFFGEERHRVVWETGHRTLLVRDISALSLFATMSYFDQNGIVVAWLR